MTGALVALPALLAQSGGTGGLLSNPWFYAVFSAASLVVAAVLLGYWFLPPLPDYWIGTIRSFAGGAILASLAAEIYPDAYQEAGPYITLATAVGFLGTFLL